MEQRGPVSYQVQLKSGMIQQRHVDHLREWVPAHVINTSSTPVISTQTPPSLAEICSDVPHEQLFLEHTHAESSHS